MPTRKETIERKRSLGCANPEECCCSSDIADNMTFGWGHLSYYGYWEFECSACARDFEKENPEYNCLPK